MKKLLLVPLFIVMLPVIIFLLASTPLVLDFVRHEVEEAVSDNLGMPFTIGSMNGNLFFSLRARDIESTELGRIDEIRIFYNPFALLSRRIEIRSVRIKGIELDINRFIETLTHLPRKADSVPSESSPVNIRIEAYSIVDGGLTVNLGQTLLSVNFASRGLMMKDLFVVDSLYLSTEKSSAFLRGSIPLRKGVVLDVVYDAILAIEDLGIGELSGSLLSKGTVQGEFSSLVISTASQVDARFVDNEIKGSVDASWHLPKIDGLNVEAAMKLTTATLQRGIEGRDTWDVKAAVERTRLSLEILSRYGHMQADGTLKGKVSEPEFEASVAGRFDYRGFTPSFKGQVYYGDSKLKLAHFNLASRRVSMDLGLQYDNKTRKITDTRLALYCSNLDVLKSIVETAENISGELWLDMVVSGSPENPVAMADLGLSDATAFGEVITNARLHASINNTVVRLDSGTVQSGRGLVNLTGYYDLKKRDFTLELRSDRLAFDSPEVFGADTLMLGGTAILDVIFSGDIRNPQGKGEIVLADVVYDTMRLGTYDLKFALGDTALQLLLTNEDMNVKFDVNAFLHDRIPFSIDAEIDNFVLDEFISPASGAVTADLSAVGYLTEIVKTKATLRIHAVDLMLEGQNLQNVDPVVVHLENEMVNIQSCAFAAAGQTIYVEGVLPLDFETASLDIKAKSSSLQLADISYLLPKNPAVTGNLKFDIRVQGKPRRLDIDGSLLLHNARYAMKDVIFDSVSGAFVFKNGLVTCQDLDGKINEGRFRANGFADLASGRLDTVLLKVDVDHVDYVNNDFGRVVIDATLLASSRKDSLRVGGEIILIEGVYDAPMRLQNIVGLLTAANRPAPQQPEISKRIYCDIGISVPDSIVIANNVANLSAKADLQLKGYLSRLNAYGTITSTGQGTIQYLGKKFNIVTAVIQFDDPYKIDPVIDLVATSTIAAADGDYEIFLVLNGTVATWQLELNSNPPLPQQDIVSLLLIGQRRPGAVGSAAKEIDLKGKAKDYAFDVVRYGIEKSGEQLLGLDKLQITGQLDEPSTMRVGIEKRITRGFTLYYSTGIESWELHQVGASYDITDHISIFTQYDQENLNTSVDLDFHFKIK
ncbi:MAG: translocation/assembly module TamB domain-containing protein [candidate division WOR-3 bacterium]|nr:MAG: translocation/assembly module TamB domain-containing protein [candidate division WOR-3 bacterium]